MLYQTGGDLHTFLCQGLKFLCADQGGDPVGDFCYFLFILLCGFFILENVILKDITVIKQIAQQIIGILLLFLRGFRLFLRFLFCRLWYIVYRLIIGHDAFYHTFGGVNAELLL